jgi:hypothetical protein
LSSTAVSLAWAPNCSRAAASAMIVGATKLVPPMP